jgi:HEAT repeat protein
MNKSGQENRKTPFEDALENLQNADELLMPLLVYHLSDLEGEKVRQVEEIWGNIPVERKRTLLEEMEQLIEENYLLSYEAVSCIGIHDEDPYTRFLAARSFYIYETIEMIPTLLEMLENDPDRDVRAACASSLGKFTYLGEIEEICPERHEEIVTCLLKTVKGQGAKKVRRHALEALGYVTHKDVPALIEEAYQRDDIDWQVSALFAMGRSYDRRWKAKVLRMLDHQHPKIRLEAARAAGEIHIKEAIPDLIELLDDEETRSAAIWALSQVGGEDEERLLQRILDETDDAEEARFLQDALDNLAFNMDIDHFDLLDFSDQDDDLWE